MVRGLRAVVGAIVCATTSGLAAHTAASQSAAQSSTARNYVAIGCISREPQASTAGQSGPNTFTITDKRATPPLKYRLDGDAEQLRSHVGHTVETAGPVTPPSSTAGSTNASALPTLKVQSLTYISMTCSK